MRNTPSVYGMVVYMGHKSKIMMNAKKPPRKISNMMRLMNYMLYTVFAFQLIIIMAFATMSAIWTKRKGEKYDYLDPEGGIDFVPLLWFVQLLTYWVAYSHMIPISLYVIIEVLKMI